MDLSIVILNWNAVEDTIRCVKTIVDWQQISPTIFIVDNASKDDSITLIKQACPTVRLIANAENLGFAGGTNRGIRESLMLGDAPILLLNNDAVIDETDVIQLLSTLSENEKYGFIGPLLFDADNTDTLISAGGKSPIKHHHTRIRKLEAGETVRPVEYVSGTAVIIRAEVFKKVGLLDENYFFSTELADLCMRGKQYGYLSIIDTQARAYHQVSRSAGLRDTLYVYYIVRNRFIFIRNSPEISKVWYTTFWTGYSVTLALKLAVSGNLATAKAVWMGLLDGLRGRFGGQNERVLSACSGLMTASSLSDS